MTTENTRGERSLMQPVTERPGPEPPRIISIDISYLVRAALRERDQEANP